MDYTNQKRTYRVLTVPDGVNRAFPLVDSRAWVQTKIAIILQKPGIISRANNSRTTISISLERIRGSLVNCSMLDTAQANEYDGQPLSK